jgi:hypothetical protein
MSKLEVDAIEPQSGTSLTLGASGDTISVPSGATLDASNATLTLPDDSVTAAKLDSTAVDNTNTNSTVITGQTAETSIDGADSILIYDDSATALRKMTRTNFVAGIGGTNTPAFEAYGLQAISENTFTKMTMATEVFDTDGDYDNVTNYRFTPSVAGKYFVYAKGFADPSSYGNLRSCQIQFYKNGSALSYTLYDIMPGNNDSANGGTGATPNARAVVDMNGSSDYLEVFFSLDTWNDSGAQVGSKQFGAYKIIE